MMSFRSRLAGGLSAGAALLLLAPGLSGCAQDAHASAPVAVTTQAQLGDALGDLAGQCGLDVDCEAGGILEGKASISGVASVDAFFQSVINFQTKATTVSGGIEAELQAIRADFGIAADADFEAAFNAQVAANVEGSLTIEAEPARCAVDASATLEAQAKCDVSVDPGTAMVMCEGSCEVEASADVQCSAGADLKCTVTAPSVACTGECKGSCEVELTAAASCEGTCKGSCSGECSAYVKNAEGEAECNGSCDGSCEGSCEAELAVAAECSGECKGECTVTNPEAGCEGGIKAECEAEAGAMVECSGRCEGNFEPPSAKAECEASAKAEAKLNVECTPPRLAINYQLRAGANVDVDAQARFVAALENLEVRLPALLAATGKARLVGEAGIQLAADAQGAVKTAVDTAVGGEANIRAQIGLGCALLALDDVEAALSESTSKLQGSVTAAASITGALGV
jgi:hypothetical protein